MTRLQETLEAERTTIHQLNTQLREKDQRLREKDELVRQKEAQLQQKDLELQQTSVEVSRLQGELQVCVCMYQEQPDSGVHWVHIHPPSLVHMCSTDSMVPTNFNLHALMDKQ